MVLYLTKLLNFFPVKNGLSSDTLSPKAIMSGEQIDYKHYNLPFGSYCQVHEDTNPRNSMAVRTLGAISLGSSGNMQFAQRFLSLKTGEVIIRYSWMELPMPDEVIDRINHFGRDQPEQIIFTDRHGNPIGDLDPAIAGVDGDGNNDNDNANDGANPPGVNDDELPGVDPGDDNEDQPPIDIFADDDDTPAPPDIPQPEVHFDEPNLVQQPEPHLIIEQPNNAVVPVTDEPIQPADDGLR